MDENKTSKVIKKINYDSHDRMENDLEKSSAYENDNTKFKKKYKEFYSDIKIDTREDW